MHFSSLSSRQIAILLPFFLSLPLQASASVCDDDIYAFDDGPTSDQSAGIGIEFETSSLLFSSSSCSKTDTDAAKGKLLGPRQDGASPPTWMLTGDTTQDIAGSLTAEYIIDGRVVKLGQSQVGPAAGAIANDITTWDPSTAQNPNTVDVDQSPCNPWTIAKPPQGGGAGNFQFAAQATAPLPLESINDIILQSKGSGSVLLTGNPRTVSRSVYVANDFFQSSPQGVGTDIAKDDVLGFFALVLSYAKSASSSNPSSSPKLLTGIMPRTDFVTIYAQISSKLPSGLDLYGLVNTLACYTSDGTTTSIDENFCSGDVTAPVVGTNLDGQTFSYGSSTLTVKDWINSISGGSAPDALTTFDQAIDGQIGGLGTALENVINTSRGVPLFEFRAIGTGITPSGFQGLAESVESQLVTYHTNNASPPSRKLKRRSDRRYAYVRRQDSSCSASVGAATPSPTPTPSPTSSAPPPPSYATGMCHIHINEYEIGCASEDSNLHAEITMWDNANNQIGYTDPANGDGSNWANFPSIDAGNSLNMQSQLSSILQVTGEHQDDYIQFTLLSDPQQSWTSRQTQDQNGDYYCNNGGWDPRDGSFCFYDTPENAKNQVDCWFKC